VRPACIEGGSLKSGASLEKGGQNNALTMVASSGLSRRVAVEAVSRAAVVPASGAALTFPLIRLLSLISMQEGH
jgi:hypothetical protein